MKYAVTLALATIAALLILTGCARSDPDGAKTAHYHCPMHPTYVSDRPGDCPICHMKLTPIKDDTGGATTNTPSLPGRVTIHIAPEKRQLIGLTTSLVETQKLAHTVRATATLAHDETTLTRIAPRFGGWVRKLNVNYTGQPVAEGDPLFTVYSPELFSAENDYLIASRNARGLTNSPANQRDAAQRLAAGARRRLELLQIGDAEIRALEERGQASDELLIRAPVSGHVIGKNAIEGKSFMAGESLYEIAPLSPLWVRASVYEYELPQIKPGQKARVTFPHLGGTNFESEVAFINPHIDPQTRRAEIRLQLDNPRHLLRPDMWAEVEIEVNIGDVLSVPASAVINTGERYVAFVDRDDGHLEPRDVKIGAKTDDYWQVLAGLNTGEKVVTRALFLVDSESQLKAAIAGMGSSGGHRH